MAETIKIAVCDDKKNIRSYLVLLIKKPDGECSITEYASADAYFSDGKEHDIIFLDIEMGGSGAGLDGMGLARHIYVFYKKKSGVSDEEYRKKIREQAYEDFAKGQFQNKSEGFNGLMKSYTSEVSPDRKDLFHPVFIQ